MRKPLFLLFVLWMAFFTYVGVRPLDGLPAISGLDKVLHLGFYGFSTLFAAYALPRRQWFLLALVFLLLHGPFIEWVQSFVPNRVASLADELANLTGLLLGLALVYWQKMLQD